MYEIGKTYRVPCARIEHFTGRIDWIPVVGPKHSDPQFANDGEHYHIDLRFIKSLGRYGEITQSGTTSWVIFDDRRNHEYNVTGIFPRLRRCHRTHTGLYPFLSSIKGTPPRWEEWARSMVGKPCRGKKCPHRGVEMQECNGLLLCPLHNLVGDPDTGRIIGAYQGVGSVSRGNLITI